jgi:DNA-binding Xre family transcriptional regulator
MTAVQLQQQAGCSANITTRLKKNAYVSLESVEKICRTLDCKMDEIVDFVPDKPQENKSEDLT